jgi:lipid-A-disaccharide synthase
MVVAGEASGDRHAADLVGEIHKRALEARFFGMGGPCLAAQNVDLLYSSTELSVMGISEVFPKLRRILRVMDGLERTARRRQPDCAILVDIPDFNLRLARKLRSLGTRIVFFVSPKVWAWRSSRIQEIADVADLMLCIFPFEEALYRRAGVRTRYVGNPVLDHVPPPGPPEEFRTRLGLEPSRLTLALLPGSRPSEIRRILPALVQAAQKLSLEHPTLQTAIPVAPTLSRDAIAAHFRQSSVQPILIDDRAPEVIGASDVAVVASGTATLEAALMRRPFVVVYRTSELTYLIGRLLIKVDHVSLANLLAGRELVRELLQHRATPDRIAAEVQRLLSSADASEEMLRGFDALRAGLGPKGAAARAADEVLALLRG